MSSAPGVVPGPNRAANCSVQRTLDIVGDRWTMIVLRELFNGVRRFEQLRRHTGISESVSSARLGKLVGAGIIDAVPDRDAGSRTRREYRLTGMAAICIRS